jgi:hypothetical protein
MADARRVELDDLVNRPGTYFNPQTEVLIVVDDSPELDTELIETDDFEEADWILVSDEVPVDEHRRDELLERFQIRQQPGVLAAHGDDEPDELDEEEELEPDEE